MITSISLQRRRLKTGLCLVGFTLFSLSAGCSSSVEKQIEEADRENRQMEKLYKEKAEEIREEAKEKRSTNPTAEFLKALSEVPPEDKREKQQVEEERK